MESGQFEPLIEVWRGERIESLHLAAIAVCRPQGEIVFAEGDSDLRLFWRSAAKPFQSLALVTSGAAERFGLDDRHLAVASASHGGEAMHLDAVRDLLARAGVDSEDLQCGTHQPLYPPAAAALARSGESPSPLHNNCSGKHAGMLALARHLGGETGRYLDTSSPGQRAIADTIAGQADAAIEAKDMAIDGCSAPTFALSLRSMATAYARIADSLDRPGDVPALSAVARAMTRHPELVAGTGRLDTALMQAAPGRLVAKIGAEGVQALAVLTPDGPLGVALKVADGDADRARSLLAIEILAAIGGADGGPLEGLRARFSPLLRNRRQLVVGQVRLRHPKARNRLGPPGVPWTGGRSPDRRQGG